MTTIERPPAVSGASAPTPPPDRARTRLSIPERVALFVIEHRRDLAWLAPVLLVAAVVSFINIGGAPQRIDDEGTYTAQAYAILNFGEIAHYTYWYDHPPLGWMQIAAYAGLTGAFARWDVPVMAGREAAIVASLVAAALLWLLARRANLSRPAATVAAALFSLSPLALQFHRTVYLDNIAVPWLLLSLVLATVRKNQLAAFTGAAVAFGVAVLTKETFLLALPLLIWLVLRTADKGTRRYTLSVAASALVLLGGSYLLLAAVKGELVSAEGRVSLMDGILFQLGTREGSGSLTDPDSLMSATVGMWWQLDAAFMVASLAAAVIALFRRKLRPYAVLLLALTAFMFRPGGYLPVPYVIMLIPLGALLVAGVVDAAVRRLRHPGARGRAVAAGVLAAAIAGAGLAGPAWATQLRGFVAADLDRTMREATSWIEDNAAREQRLIVDNGMWVDFVEAGWDRDNVLWYYKLDTDPAVTALSPNGWRDSDFIISTQSMRTFPTEFPQVAGALQNSVPVAVFGEGDQAVEIRQIVPDGVEAANERQGAAFTRQSALGQQLAANPSIEMPDAAREMLAAGHVDERIITVLGALSAQRTLAIDGFPLLPGEQSPIARQVAITSIDGAALEDQDLAAFADLGADFTPEEVSIDGDGHAVLRFAHTAP
jgi:hypothetical protein